MSRHGGPHHHFFGGDRVASPVLVACGVRAASAVRLFAAARRALASVLDGLLGVTLAKVAPAAALLAACRLTSSVRSTKAWPSASSEPETAVGRGRQKRSCANSEKTRSAYVLACPLLLRRRKPDRVRGASSLALWVRQPPRMRATADACSRDRGGPFDSASTPWLTAALAQLSKKA
jgi:hypothetical protein